MPMRNQKKCYKEKSRQGHGMICSSNYEVYPIMKQEEKSKYSS